MGCGSDYRDKEYVVQHAQDIWRRMDQEKKRNQMTQKFVYIAHPISGACTSEYKANIEVVEHICRQIVLDSKGSIIPVAPYLGTLRYLNDELEGQRRAGMLINFTALKDCHEMWVYGFSPGVMEEIEQAVKGNVPITYHTWLKEEVESQNVLIDGLKLNY